jgi:hypothetical protein
MVFAINGQHRCCDGFLCHRKGWLSGGYRSRELRESEVSVDEVEDGDDMLLRRMTPRNSQGMKSVIVKGSARALSRTISASLLKGGWMDKPGSFAYME